MNHYVEHHRCARGEDLPQARLTEVQVRVIRAQYGPKTAKQLAQEHGVHQRTIDKVVTWGSWRHVR